MACPADGSPVDQATPEEMPTWVATDVRPLLEFTPGTILLDRYRIVSRLGRGGMGEVYRADDLKLGQPVALKFVVPRLAQQQQQLVDEVRVGRKVSHPNVCRLHDIGEIEGRLFLSMEYIDGEDLGSLLRRVGRLPHDKAVSLAREITAGVVAAHDGGIVHRDLKPANVMIDGRGTAHITDFGLARTDAAGSPDTFSGTPPYMAPEQFNGEPATAASDVYALGLIFFELWTGRRLFNAKSVPEIVSLHRPEFIRGSIRSAPELEPQIATVVEACLDRDPSRRPASARAVLSLLPGRDALDSAVALGHTPSPALVAAASVRGDLTRAQAWSIFAAILTMFAALIFLGEKTALHRKVDLKYPAPALQTRSIQMLDALGWGEGVLPRTDSDGWFLSNNDFLRWREADAKRNSASLVRSIEFAFRQSPRFMVSSWIDGNPMLWLDDPPMTVPGMARIVLDASGRLSSLQVVPPERLTDVASGQADWAKVLQFAGVDPRALTAVAPTHTAPVDNDAKAAWDGRDPIDGVPLHLEAASLRGRPVWFKVFGGWERGSEPAAAARPGDSVANLVITILIIAVVLGSFLLVRRNLRRGQGDVRGATRIAVAVLLATAVAGALRAHHVTNLMAEAELGAGIFMRAVYLGFFMWIGYVAAEPLVRRRWPRALISWSRLLEGRFTDPMIGRDVLVGFMATLITFLTAYVAGEIVAYFLRVPQPPNKAAMSALTSPRFLAYFLVYAAVVSVTRGAGLLLELVLVRGLVRNQAATVVLVTLAMIAAALPMMQGPLPMRLVLAAVVSIGPVFLVIRFGLLAVCSMAWLVMVFLFVPITFHPGSWHFLPSLGVIALIVGIAAAAFYTSLGGKAPFAGPLFEE